LDCIYIKVEIFINNNLELPRVK
jgi:hypothetical protein